MSENPPASGPYGPPPGSGQPYGQPAPQQGGYPGQPAYGTPYGPPGGFNNAPAPSKRWYQRWWVWLIIVIVIAGIAVFVFGRNHVSKYQLQDKIKDAFQDQGKTVSDVKCPNNVNTDRGSTTTCTAVFQGQTLTLNIRFDEDRHFIVTTAN